MTKSLFGTLNLHVVVLTLVASLTVASAGIVLQMDERSNIVAAQESLMRSNLYNMYNGTDNYLISLTKDQQKEDFFYRLRDQIQTHFPLMRAIQIIDKNMNELITLPNDRFRNNHDGVFKRINSHCSMEPTKISSSGFILCIDLQYLNDVDQYQTLPSHIKRNWLPIFNEQYVLVYYVKPTTLDFLLSSKTTVVIYVTVTLFMIIILNTISYIYYKPLIANFLSILENITRNGKRGAEDTTSFRELNESLNIVEQNIKEQNTVRVEASETGATNMVHDTKTMVLTLKALIDELIEETNSANLGRDVISKSLLAKTGNYQKLIELYVADCDSQMRRVLIDKNSSNYVKLTHDEKVDIRTIFEQVMLFVRFNNSDCQKSFMLIPHAHLRSHYFINSFFIRNCLQTIISNAIKYSGAGNDLIIIRVNCVDTIDTCRTTLQFEVIDFGNGVPEQIRPLLFRQKLSDEVANQSIAAGLGVGLYSLSQMAEETGDSLALIETEHETGACFRIEIPNVQHSKWPIFREPSEARIGLDIQNSVVRTYLETFISDAGYTVTHSTQPVDFLITDDEIGGFNHIQDGLLISFSSDKNLFTLKLAGVLSELDDETALFELIATLASIEPKPHPINQRVESDSQMRRGRVLFVEDNTMIAEATKKTLIEIGLDVDAYQRSQHAMLKLSQEPSAIDFYILDYKLNSDDVTGSELLSKLHSLTDDLGLPRKPSISLSANTKDQVCANDVQNGHLFDYYVTKGAHATVLARTVVQLISDRQLPVLIQDSTFSSSNGLSVDISDELRLARQQLMFAQSTQDVQCVVKVLETLSDLCSYSNGNSLRKREINKYLVAIRDGNEFQYFDEILQSIDAEISIMDKPETITATSSTQALVTVDSIPVTDQMTLDLLCQKILRIFITGVYAPAIDVCQTYNSLSQRVKGEIGIQPAEIEAAGFAASHDDETKAFEAYTQRIVAFYYAVRTPAFTSRDINVLDEVLLLTQILNENHSASELVSISKLLSELTEPVTNQLRDYGIDFCLYQNHLDVTLEQRKLLADAICSVLPQLRQTAELTTEEPMGVVIPYNSPNYVSQDAPPDITKLL